MNEVTYVKAKFVAEAIEWLIKHCQNRYYVAVPRHVVSNTAVFAFYEEDDATMFRLRYGI